MKRLWILCAAAVTFSADAAELCRVVKVADGDTVTVRCPNRKSGERVRLLGIDAPELLQAYGKEAHTALSNICKGKEALVERHGKDQYRRTLARITCDGVDAQRYMVDNGWAWAMRRDVDVELQSLESEARKNKRGLWQDDRPKSPWRFRRENK
jgi:micrococcal nuclease